MHYILREYGKIFRKEDFQSTSNTPEAVFAEARTFAALERLADTSEGIFITGKRGGKPFLQVAQYVGIIETEDQKIVEILPKIYTGETDSDKDELVRTRKLFLRMLRSLPDAPFRYLGDAYLAASDLPLTEIFISAFTEATLLLVQRGLRDDYALQEANEPFLRGKLLFTENFKQNLTKPHRFYTENDEYQKDIAPNRLLKTAIEILLRRTRNYANRGRLQHLQSYFSQVPQSRNVAADLEKTQVSSRRFPHYEMPLTWAKIFLQEQNFAPLAGKKKGISLLFPAERIFEKFIALQFQKYHEGAEITLQDSRLRLLHTEKGEKFTLRPDVVAETEDTIHVIDTKWKILNPDLPTYGIAQADLYQMFSYGEKYSARGKEVKLHLIYPRTALHPSVLPNFSFHKERLPLSVVLYDLSKAGRLSIQEILAS